MNVSEISHRFCFFLFLVVFCFFPTPCWFWHEKSLNHIKTFISVKVLKNRKRPSFRTVPCLDVAAVSFVPCSAILMRGVCVWDYASKWKPVGFMPPVHARCVTVSDVGTVNSFLARLQRERWLAVALSTDSASTGMTKQTESPATLEGKRVHTHTHRVSHPHFLSFFFFSCTSPLLPVHHERVESWISVSKAGQQRYH